ncbi:hypothetical protein BC567DRAFT_232117 [Phyllosticta citribraziliensis]
MILPLVCALSLSSSPSNPHVCPSPAGGRAARSARAARSQSKDQLCSHRPPLAICDLPAPSMACPPLHRTTTTLNQPTNHRTRNEDRWLTAEVTVPGSSPSLGWLAVGCPTHTTALRQFSTTSNVAIAVNFPALATQPPSTVVVLAFAVFFGCGREGKANGGSRCGRARAVDARCGFPRAESGGEGEWRMRRDVGDGAGCAKSLVELLILLGRRPSFLQLLLFPRCLGAREVLLSSFRPHHLSKPRSIQPVRQPQPKRRCTRALCETPNLQQTQSTLIQR